MANRLYEKPVLFSVLALVTVLVGTIVTMAYPMLRPEMHPKLDKLQPFTPLELAGRDIYQREGCHNCHTQTVRPLASEVKRYGEYSKAGEFAYDRPFLWGSKRTGPDLAREGGKRPDGWHVKHFTRPQDFEPQSDMPAYAFLAGARVDVAEAKQHYAAFASLTPGMKASDADFAALEGETEMDALVAYMQWLGHAVPRACGVGDLQAKNPFAGNALYIQRGMALYANNCAQCHGDHGEGLPGAVPSLIDDEFLGVKGDVPDGTYFGLITCGSDAKKEIGRPGDPGGGMTAFGGQLSDEDIWSVITFIRSAQKHESSESHH